MFFEGGCIKPCATCTNLPATNSFTNGGLALKLLIRIIQWNKNYAKSMKLTQWRTLGRSINTPFVFVNKNMARQCFFALN